MTMQLLLVVAAAPFVAWVVLLCLRQPLTVALPVYAALIQFSGVLSVAPGRFGSLSSIAGMLLGAGLALQLIRKRGVGLPMSATIPVWILLLAAAGATVLWSQVPATTVGSFAILGSLVAVYVLVALSSVDRAVVRRVENGLIAGGLLAVGYGLYQLLVLGGFPSDPPVPGSTDGRFGNDLLGPNNQAVALILPLVVCLSRAVTESLRSRRSMYTVMSALLLLGVLMTGSRGGVLATGVALITLVSFVPRGKARLASYGLAGLAVAATIFIATPFGLAERTVETTSSSGRTDIWKVGLAACPQYCAFGSGWGTFSQVYADTQATVPDARVLVGGGAYEPHNVWILVAIELGVPGLLLLAAGLFLTVREALRLPSGLRAPPLSALTATIFAAFFLSNLEFKFFWMALILVALSRNVTEAPSDGADVAVGAEADTRTASIRP